MIGRTKTMHRLTPWVAFLAALTVYWLTVEPTASWWDCPEYLTTALLLEVGHPPGNPFWTLTHRFVSLLAPDVSTGVLLVNMAAGLFMAIAVGLLCSTLQIMGRFLFRRRGRTPWGQFAICAGALAGSLCFAWADSPWYSAVEAEVYSMSMFLTALCFWLMIRRDFARTRRQRSRILILVGYLTGISIGVHQLNLLAIPALALIFVFRRMQGRRAVLRAARSLLISVCVVAAILLGMMPSMLLYAGYSDLFAVNVLGLPYNSGAVIYALLTLAVAFATPLAVAHFNRSWVWTLMISLTLFMMGLTTFSGNVVAGAAVALFLGWLAARNRKKRRKGLLVGCWMLPMLLTGYGCYSLLLIRGVANPPMNQGSPDTPFSLLTYLEREQYGSTPLFYGPTPLSKPMRREIHRVSESGDTSVVYGDFLRRPVHAVYSRSVPGGAVSRRSGLLSREDSVRARLLSRPGKRGYVKTDYTCKIVYSPEQDMYLPRIHSRDAGDIAAFRSWVGMDTASMVPVEVSETLDPEGRPAGRIGADGERHRRLSYRPSYLQSAEMMLKYQFGYMYFRYLMWNFSGRQNDFHSTGEVEHGNFITGFPFIDDAMLGPQDEMPPYASSDNRGRHVYFMIPLLLGIAGGVFMLMNHRRGRRTFAVVATLFLMTGLAIVFYLNQSPGEPRERDYSFLGSLWAYSLWIGYAFMWLMARSRRPLLRGTVVLAAFAVPVWMIAQNWGDHDRSGRDLVDVYAANLLESLDPNAIIFVHGDNFTFPLWYLQHVKGVRRDVTIVNISYLSTSWYVRQLLLPQWEAPGLKMTIGERQLAYGAYAVVRLPFSHEEKGVSMDAVEALRCLYADDRNIPVIPSRLLVLESPDGEGRTLDLTKAMGKVPGQTVGIRDLMMLDIVATNAADSLPRPVYWHQTVGGGTFGALRPFTRLSFLTRKYAPEMPDGEYLLDDAMRALPKMKWGNLEDNPRYYAEEVTGRQITQQRLALYLLARELQWVGRYEEAMHVTKTLRKALPEEAWIYDIVGTGDSTVNMSRGIGSLLMELGREMKDPAAVTEGEGILRRGDSVSRDWRRYYRRLSPQRRTTLSPATRRQLR